MEKQDEESKIGRPSDYDPKYCDEIIKFFDREPYEEREVDQFNKKGEVIGTKYVQIACMCPTFEKFAADIGISRQTLLTWSKKHPEFLVAYSRARQLQANIMMVNGMSGLFNSGFTGLSMKNMHGWSDKQEIDNTHSVNAMPTVKIDGEDLIFDIGSDVDENEK